MNIEGLEGWLLVTATVVGAGEPGTPVAAFVLEQDAQRFIDDDDSDGAYSYELDQM